MYQLLKQIVIKKDKDKKNNDRSKEDGGAEYFVTDPKDFKNQQALDVKTNEVIEMIIFFNLSLSLSLLSVETLQSVFKSLAIISSITSESLYPLL